MGFAPSGPFRDLEQVLDRVTDQLEQVEPGMRRRPRVDVEDVDDRFVVSVDLPGFEKDEIELQLRDDVLSIEAEHDEEHEESDARYVRRERRHEAVSRSIPLPESVDEDATTATYERGVLVVTLPKTHQGEGTRVDVE